jgi:hypothetical protein
MKTGRPSYYWDTCIFLHWITDLVKIPGVIEGIEDTIKAAERGDAIIISSIITRIEVLRSDMTADQAETFLRLREREYIQWVNVDSRVAVRAHDFRNYYKVLDKAPHVPDSIHVATATLFDVTEMNTLDGSSKKKRRFDLLPLSGNVMGGQYKLVIKQPERVVPIAPTPPNPPLFRMLDLMHGATDEEA